MADETLADRNWTIAVAAASAAYFLWFASWFPFDFQDEGYVLYVSRAFSEGLLPFRDVRLFNYFPGVFYLYGIPFRIEGISLESARHFMGLGLAATAVVWFRLLRRFLPLTEALFLISAFLLVPGRPHRFYIPLMCGMLFLALLGLRERPSNVRGFAFGFLTGLGWLMRIDQAVIGTLFVMVLIVEQHRGGVKTPWPALLAGIGAAVVPAATLYMLAGLLPQAVGQVLSSPLGIAERILRSPPRLLMKPGFGTFGPTDALSDFLLCMALVPPFVFGIMLWRNWRHLDAFIRWDYAAAGVLIFCNLPQFAIERQDSWHLTDRLAAIGLSVAVSVSLWRLIPQTGSGMARWPQLARAAAAGVAGFVVLCMLRPLEIGSLSTFFRPRATVRLSNGAEYTAYPASGGPELLESVLLRTSALEPVAVLPFMPGINFLLDRRTPGRDVYFLEHSGYEEGAEARYIFELDSARSPWVVLPEPRYFDKEVRPGSGADIYRYLQAHFHPVLGANGMVLLGKNPDLPQSATDPAP